MAPKPWAWGNEAIPPLVDYGMPTDSWSLYPKRGVGSNRLIFLIFGRLTNGKIAGMLGTRTK